VSAPGGDREPAAAPPEPVLTWSTARLALLRAAVLAGVLGGVGALTAGPEGALGGAVFASFVVAPATVVERACARGRPSAVRYVLAAVGTWLAVAAGSLLATLQTIYTVALLGSGDPAEGFDRVVAAIVDLADPTSPGGALVLVFTWVVWGHALACTSAGAVKLFAGLRGTSLWFRGAFGASLLLAPVEGALAAVAFVALALAREGPGFGVGDALLTAAIGTVGLVCLTFPVLVLLRLAAWVADWTEAAIGRRLTARRP